MSDDDVTSDRDDDPADESSSRPRRSRSCSRRSSTGSASTWRSRSRSGTACSAGACEGEDVGLFIGRHGQTIDAVQHLAQRIVFPEGPSSVRVVIDADGYRERRAEALRAEADDAAEEALQLGQAGRARPDAAVRAADRARVPARARRTSRRTARARSPSAISWSRRSASWRHGPVRRLHPGPR